MRAGNTPSWGQPGLHAELSLAEQRKGKEGNRGHQAPPGQHIGPAPPLSIPSTAARVTTPITRLTLHLCPKSSDAPYALAEVPIP